MPHPVRILIVEDNLSDADLLLFEVRRGGWDPAWVRVETEAAFLQALDDRPDLILSDLTLPRFDGLRGLGHADRQFDDEQASLAEFALEFNLAAQQFRQFLGDRQAQAGPFVFAGQGFALCRDG